MKRTSAFQAFHDSFRELLNLYLHYSLLCQYTEHDKDHYLQFLAKHTELIEHRDDFFYKFFVRDVVMPHDKARLIYEMTFARIVDAYLLYLASVLKLVFISDPRTLISNDTVTVKSVLECKNLDEFVASFADKKVSALSYKSLSNLAEFFEDRIGVPLHSDKHPLSLLNKLVMDRNILVHNRGIINELYVSVTGSGTLGDRLHIDDKAALRSVVLLDESAEILDGILVDKFQLECVQCSKS